VDINGHVNSVKYIDHVLDLFSLDYYKSHRLKRIDIAYVAESHAGDTLCLYKKQTISTEEEDEYVVRMTKESPAEKSKEVEIVRCKVKFVKD
jgi:medium-chain acyl-[acyl-carrier-protein] hydrolase